MTANSNPQLPAPTNNKEDMSTVKPADGIAIADVSILKPAPPPPTIVVAILNNWPLGTIGIVNQQVTYDKMG